MHGLFVLAPLLIAIVAVAATQEDCPDAATDCPDSCAGEQCASSMPGELLSWSLCPKFLLERPQRDQSLPC